MRLIKCFSLLLCLFSQAGMAQAPELIPYRKGDKFGYAKIGRAHV